ncbi:hypothetical protein COT47_03810, partial [Candidatus Woesearchaeota archaeon CG08_land_8_20_14_0_20_43_7]
MIKRFLTTIALTAGIAFGGGCKEDQEKFQEKEQTKLGKHYSSIFKSYSESVNHSDDDSNLRNAILSYKTVKKIEAQVNRTFLDRRHHFSFVIMYNQFADHTIKKMGEMNKTLLSLEKRSDTISCKDIGQKINPLGPEQIESDLKELGITSTPALHLKNRHDYLIERCKLNIAFPSEDDGSILNILQYITANNIYPKTLPEMFKLAKTALNKTTDTKAAIEQLEMIAKHADHSLFLDLIDIAKERIETSETKNLEEEYAITITAKDLRYLLDGSRSSNEIEDKMKNDKHADSLEEILDERAWALIAYRQESKKITSLSRTYPELYRSSKKGLTQDIAKYLFFLGNQAGKLKVGKDDIDADKMRKFYASRLYLDAARLDKRYLATYREMNQ